MRYQFFIEISRICLSLESYSFDWNRLVHHTHDEKDNGRKYDF